MAIAICCIYELLNLDTHYVVAAHAVVVAGYMHYVIGDIHCMADSFVGVAGLRL